MREYEIFAGTMQGAADIADKLDAMANKYGHGQNACYISALREPANTADPEIIDHVFDAVYLQGAAIREMILRGYSIKRTA